MKSVKKVAMVAPPITVNARGAQREADSLRLKAMGIRSTMVGIPGTVYLLPKRL